MHSSPAHSALLADLNEPQRTAVTHRDGPLLVLAGPGSGKTRVITRRAAYLVHGGVPPRNVLCITFTNKAADEMKRRIEALGVARGMWVCTFHALCVRLLREFGELGRVRSGFSIYDEADQRALIKQAMAECRVNPDTTRPEAVAAAISKLKNDLVTPGEAASRADYFEERTIARVYEAYERLMIARNAVDFDDLLMRVALVLRSRGDVAERLNIRFQYVLVDEYQDTNHAQYLIAHHLSRFHENLCVTGDPDQSIYAWRGANLSNILDFERDHPRAKVVRLEQNYRSTQAIVRAASAVIARNKKRKPKELWTENEPGEPIVIREYEEGRDEAVGIAANIAEERRAGRPFGDFAIFYRVNAISRGLEEALRDQGIHYRVARGVAFYERREIKDVLAYLRLLVNPSDEVALLRVINTPTRGIGKTTIDRVTDAIAQTGWTPLDVLRRAADFPTLQSAAARLGKFAALIDALATFAAGSVAETVSNVLTLSGLEAALKKESEEDGEDRLANVQELVTAATTYEEGAEEPTLADFLQRVALTSDQDAVDESAGVVMLMTLHAAKGLEFPFVFIVGFEQGLLPHENSLRGRDRDIEEERRLCFVGITRARQRLVISHARQRLLRGMMTPQTASEFLYELPPEVTRSEHVSAADEFDNEMDRSGADDELDGGSPERDETGGTGRGTHDRGAIGGGAGGARVDSRLRTSSRRRRDSDEPAFTMDDPTRGAPRTMPEKSPFADWTPGTFVQHKLYGVGQIVTISGSAGQTRASIKFAGQGPRTFVLEFTPIEKLERASKSR
ncbi:MAG: UvrD-helicase domain-containing protein [Phycisphaerae bacterium]